MGDVTAVNMDVATESSGHTMVPNAVSVCTTPAAPSPLPLPYPVTASISEGVTDPAMRTKINGAKVLTVGSVFNACHGNEPGTLKEVVSLNTGGPCFIVAGAPTVICELGFMGITGSPGFMNKAITVGAGANAGDAKSANDKGGSSQGTGQGADKSKNPNDTNNTGSGNGGDSNASSGPTSDERALAAQENAVPDDGKNAARKEARKKVAEDFYRKNDPSKWDADKKCLRRHTDAEIHSEMKGIDFDKPVRAAVTPPPAKAFQWQPPGRQKPPGQYFSEQPMVPPTRSGIGRYGVSRHDGSVREKINTGYDIPPGTPVLHSTASPRTDDWSVPAGGKSDPHGDSVFYRGMKQSSTGGAQQMYIPRNGGLSPDGAGSKQLDGTPYTGP